MSLRVGDLKDMVDNILEVDSYKSKMGNDENIVVLSFTVMEEAPAQDLVNFIERGYSFVLDADVSSGEQSDGMYRVFVEIERDPGVSEQIMELMDGVTKLTGNNDFKFRYYKSFDASPVTLEELTSRIPTDPGAYASTVNESNMNNFKNFFNKSYVNEITLSEDEELIIKKSYADPLGFKVKSFGESMAVNESIAEKINMNDYAEIMFLTKYIGDYNITKYGRHTLTFENSGHTLVLERL
jgi:hypothetical protein